MKDNPIDYVITVVIITCAIAVFLPYFIDGTTLFLSSL